MSLEYKNVKKKINKIYTYARVVPKERKKRGGMKIMNKYAFKALTVTQIHLLGPLS